MQTSAHAANLAGLALVDRDALLAMEVDRPLDGQQLTALYVRRPYDARPSLVFVDAKRLQALKAPAIHIALVDMLTRPCQGVPGTMTAAVNEDTEFVTIAQLVAELGTGTTRSNAGLEGLVRGWMDQEGWQRVKRLLHGFRAWGYERPKAWIPTTASASTASVFDRKAGQQIHPSTVEIPGRAIARGDGPVVVEIYTVGAGVTVKGEGSDPSGREGRLELEANGTRLVVAPLCAIQADWCVVPIEGYVAAVRLQIEAVNQEELAKFGNVGGQGFTPQKTAIFSAPAGFGKSTIAHAMAAFIGCTHVVEEWDPATPAVLGALHLTSSPLPAQGWTDAAPKQQAYTADSADTELEILQRAEGFMLGFEGDASQPGVDDQLVNLRYLIEQRRAKKGAGLLLELARRVARLNPNAGEIGAGMLASLVIDAQNALTAAGERA